MKQKRQFSKYINKVNNVFCLYLLVTGEKRQRSESNHSDQSDEDHLPQKQKVSKKHKLFEYSPYDISIGRGKKPASGKAFQKKGIPLESISSLPTKRQRTHKGKCSVLIKISFILYSSVTSDKRLRTEHSNIDDDEDNLSDTQRTSSEQSLSDSD